MATEYGETLLNSFVRSEGAGPGEPMSVKIHFCYQATASFPCYLYWTFSQTSSNRAAKITYTELGGSENVNTFASPAADSSGSVTLPASTFCYVVAEVTGDGDSNSTLDVKIAQS